MKYLIRYLSVGSLMLFVGCTSGGWCGSSQPTYPVGTYPLPGNPGPYPSTGYPPGAVGQPGVAPGLNGQQAPTLPYGTPIPSTYAPQAGYPAQTGYPAGYPGGYPPAGYPQSQGVPLGSMAPGRPFIGQ